MIPGQDGVASILERRTVSVARLRRAVSWTGLAFASAAGAGFSVFVVWSYVLSADEPFGLIVPATFLLLSVLGLLIVIAVVAHAAKNDFGYFNHLTYLIVTVGWCLLVWRIPNAIIHDPHNSSYSQMAPAGVWTVAMSTFSIMCAVWVMGVPEILWRIRIALLLSVFTAHAPLIVWLLGLPPA